MVESQKTIGVYESTFDNFKRVKVLIQAKIGKELSDNEFVLELLECMIQVEKLKI